MAILSSDILPNHGPYVEFADCPRKLGIAEDDWPDRALYQENIFFEFGDSLIDTFELFTGSSLPFDKYELTQLKDPREILQLSSEILIWAFQISRSFNFYILRFRKELDIYQNSTRFAEGETPTLEHLHQDMLESLLFLASRMHQIAFSKRCLVIVGF